MLQSENGRRLLDKKPLISNDLIIKRIYPTGSLGEVYKRYMLEHEFQPEDRSKVKYMTDKGFNRLSLQLIFSVTFKT